MLVLRRVIKDSWCLCYVVLACVVRKETACDHDRLASRELANFFQDSSSTGRVVVRKRHPYSANTTYPLYGRGTREITRLLQYLARPRRYAYDFWGMSTHRTRGRMDAPMMTKTSARGRFAACCHFLANHRYTDPPEYGHNYRTESDRGSNGPKQCPAPSLGVNKVR